MYVCNMFIEPYWTELHHRWRKVYLISNIIFNRTESRGNLVFPRSHQIFIHSRQYLHCNGKRISVAKKCSKIYKALRKHIKSIWTRRSVWNWMFVSDLLKGETPRVTSGLESIRKGTTRSRPTPGTGITESGTLAIFRYNSKNIYWISVSRFFR